MSQGSIIGAALLAFLLPVPAWAYLDPGTGSIILQGIIAGLAVAGLTIKTYWYRLKSLFGRSESSSLLEEEEALEKGEENS